MDIRWLLPAALAAFAAVPARAEVKTHGLFTDHMVLQQGKKIPLWGTATGAADIAVEVAGKVFKTKAVDGAWKVELDPLPAGGPLEIAIAADEGGKVSKTVLKDVLVGEVWVCSGQSNMEWVLRNSFEPKDDIAHSKNDKIRLFTVNKNVSEKPITDFKPGGGQVNRWLECGPETTPNFSAVGYYFGRALQKALGVPVGLIHSSWGGMPAQAFTSKESLDIAPLKHYHDDLAKKVATFSWDKADLDYRTALDKYEAAVAKIKAENEGKPKEQQQKLPNRPTRATKPGLNPNDPSALYNAMIHPLINFPIAGAIWYQGESNAGAAYEYRTLMPAMIADWRKAWHDDSIGFYMVQLAPFNKIVTEPGSSPWAELREAQLMATHALPKVGMAVITDVGEENDIHPKKKAPVGERLALAALHTTYGKLNEPCGPEYKAVAFDGNKAVLHFDHLGGGLEVRGDKLTGFAIAGEDRKFHNADAKIEGDTVVVSSPEVAKPVAVRFGWAQFPVVNLWSKASLPATPFRTDDFPITTGPRK